MLSTTIVDVFYSLGNVKFKMIFLINLEVLVNEVVCIIPYNTYQDCVLQYKSNAANVSTMYHMKVSSQSLNLQWIPPAIAYDAMTIAYNN